MKAASIQSWRTVAQEPEGFTRFNAELTDILLELKGKQRVKQEVTRSQVTQQNKSAVVYTLNLKATLCSFLRSNFYG